MKVKLTGIGAVAFVIIILVMFAMSVEGDGYVAIDCPEGYGDCKGIPLSTPEPTPVETSTPVAIPTPEPTPVFTCIHQHNSDGVMFVHYGHNHLDVNEAVGVYQSYSPERCGHE